MRKKTVARIAGTVMAAVVAVTQLGVLDNIRVFAEETNSVELTPETVTLQDADFTGDLWNDGIWNVNPSTWDNGVAFTYFTYADDSWMTTDDNEGTSGLKFWMPDGGTFEVTQTVSVLPAGEYTLTSYVMGENADISLTLDGTEGNIEATTADAVTLAGYNTWQMVTATFEVSEDASNVSVGFKADVDADGYGYLDHLTISGKTKEAVVPTYTEVNAEDYTFGTTNLISNGDFETGDSTGWTVCGDTDITHTVKTDQWAKNNTTNFLNVYNGGAGAENVEVSQEISLSAGTYLLSLDMDGMAVSSGLSFSLGTIQKEFPTTTGWDAWSIISVAFTLSADDTAELKIAGNIPAEYWFDLDNISLVKVGLGSDNDDNQGDGSDDAGDDADEDTDDSTAVEANISVKKISGLSEDFITGADVSSYLSIVNSGACFYDEDGNKLTDQGFFDLLKAGGTNYIRLRVWNNPYDANGNGYGGGNNDLEAAKVMGQWATNAGMKVLIDFHFSDFWADPAKQQAPKAWASMSHTEKEEAISGYTTTSLQYLLDAGVDVGMVQIGNETTNGFCGETYNGDGWSSVCELFNSGCQAVRSVAATNDRDIQIALHFTNPERGNYPSLAKNLNDNGVDYDVFASSYYPYWHGTLSNLTSTLKTVAETYNKKVMVAETSWATSLEDGDGHDNTVRVGSNDDNSRVETNYAFSVQGQADEISAVAKAIKNVGDAGIGLFYWEAAWIPVEYSYDEDGNLISDIVDSNKVAWEANGSGWASSYGGEYDPEDAGKWYGGSAVDNQAWFDFNGKALETVNIYNYIRTGTKAPRIVSSISVDDITVSLSKLDTVSLPDTVTLNFNDSTTEVVSVKWDEKAFAAAKAAGVGTYTIKGTYTISSESGEDSENEVSITLTIEYDNLLTNPSFEDGLADWNVSSSMINTGDASSNSRTGSGCAHFYSTNAGDSATATQTVVLNAGKYQLAGYVQGGGSGETDVISLKAIVGDETYSAEGELTGWKVWSNPTIDEIVITEDNTEVQVVISLENVTAGVWGAFDDITLYRTGDYITESDSDDNDDKDDADKEDVVDSDKGETDKSDTETDKDDADKENVVDSDKDETDTETDKKDDAGKGDSEVEDKEEATDKEDVADKKETFVEENIEEILSSFAGTVEVVVEDVRTLSNKGILIAGDKSVLPEGTKFEVCSLATTAESYVKAKSVLTEKKIDGKFVVNEINLKGADGTQIHQMDDYVIVTISVPEGFTVSASKTIGVYRLEDDGTLTKCASDVVDGKLSFSTNHFSTYIFVEEPVVVADVPAENNGNSTGNVSAVANATPVESATPTALTSVKTGDETDFLSQMMFVLAGIALVTLALVYGTRKKISI